MKFIQELLQLNEVKDFDRWFADQGKQKVEPPPHTHDSSADKTDRLPDKIVSDVYKKLKDLGVKNIIRGVVDNWLLGGGGYNLTDFLEQLEKLGYNSAWSTYDDNEEFWKKLGVSKDDLETLLDASNE